MKQNVGIVILAAGKGKRMGGIHPKVMFELDGRPLIDYVIETAGKLEPERICVVVGFGREQVKEHLAGRDNLEFAVQEPQLGTGHAVIQTKDAFRGFRGMFMVLYGDVPLISLETLRKLIRQHEETGAAATILSAEYANPFGYGRIIRDDRGNVNRIVEEKDAPDEIKKIREINTGIYVFDADKLFAHLDELRPENVQKELYITDMIGIFRKKGFPVGAVLAQHPEETYGVNTPEQLEELRQLLKSH